MVGTGRLVGEVGEAGAPFPVETVVVRRVGLVGLTTGLGGAGFAR